MEVNYNEIYTVKNDKKISEKELKDIIARKLLHVVLASEENNSVALNNS